MPKEDQKRSLECIFRVRRVRQVSPTDTPDKCTVSANQFSERHLIPVGREPVEELMIGRVRRSQFGPEIREQKVHEYIMTARRAARAKKSIMDKMVWLVIESIVIPVVEGSNPIAHPEKPLRSVPSNFFIGLFVGVAPLEQPNRLRVRHRDRALSESVASRVRRNGDPSLGLEHSFRVRKP
jgi:hypothetical protein